MVQPTNRLGEKEPNDDHYRVDFHPEHQEIASVDTDTGEYQEKRLAHPKEAEEFYRSLSCVGQVVRVGMEASGSGFSDDEKAAFAMAMLRQQSAEGRQLLSH